MSSDEIVWQVINQQFCSFKLKSAILQLAVRGQSQENLLIILSQAQHKITDSATGALYLYCKTPERAHLPSQWWEKIRLPNNYEKALAQIDGKLIYWPKFLIHKCKQRLTRLTQVAIRSRRIAKEEERLGEKLVPRLASKVKRREATRERKAESAAKVERAIERELIERLRSGAYGDRPLNVEEGVWKKVLRGLERAEKGEDALEEEDEAEEEGELEVEYVSDFEESEGEAEGEMEDFDDWLGGESADEDDEDDEGDSDEEDSEGSHEDGSEGSKDDARTGSKRKLQAPQPKARKKPARVEIEYETELPQKETLLA